MWSALVNAMIAKTSTTLYELRGKPNDSLAVLGPLLSNGHSTVACLVVAFCNGCTCYTFIELKFIEAESREI
jgi:hypothetical protein